jgi:hypothetical protein
VELPAACNNSVNNPGRQSEEYPDMSESRSTTVNIVGGGLAGMVAALELVKRGVSVRLYESSGRLGGKAGSYANPPIYNSRAELDPSLRLPDGVESDHGYHVFPKWYTNMRHLWQEIGVGTSDVYEGRVYLDLFPAENGNRVPFKIEPPPGPKQVLSICDLVIQPDRLVVDLTLEGFLHSRDYHHPERPLSLTEFILNALTIGDEDISSRAARDTFRQWLPVFSQANWDALRGSLDEILIRRLQAAIIKAAEKSGVQYECFFNHRMIDLSVDDHRHAQITIEGPRDCFVVSGGPILLTIPQEVLRTFCNGVLYDRLPELSKLNYLRSNPFSAIDIFFDRKLPNMNLEHFTLTGSPFGLTGFDISMHWPKLIERNRTVLQFVAANSPGFRGLDGSSFIKVITREIAKYFPEVPAQVEMYVPHTNMDAPLFVNDVMTENWRPQNRTAAENLFLGGDFVMNPTHVTSMEGATRSGRMAAQAIREKYFPETPQVEILPVQPMPPELQGIINLAETDPVDARLMCLGWFSRMMAAARMTA